MNGTNHTNFLRELSRNSWVCQVYTGPDRPFTTDARIGVFFRQIFSQMGEYEIGYQRIGRELSDVCKQIVEKRLQAEIDFAEEFVRGFIPELQQRCNAILNTDHTKTEKARRLHQEMTAWLTDPSHQQAIDGTEPLRIESHFWLTRVPSYLQYLTRLESLLADGCSLEKIEHLPPNLKALKLEAQNIQEIENLPAPLESLNLSRNKIREIKNLSPNLIFLNLNHNRLQAVEGGLPPSLQWADFGENRELRVVKGLPEDLRKLYIRKNPALTEIELPASLIFLDIDEEKIPLIREIPPNLVIYSGLKKIDLNPREESSKKRVKTERGST